MPGEERPPVPTRGGQVQELSGPTPFPVKCVPSEEGGPTGGQRVEVAFPPHAGSGVLPHAGNGVPPARRHASERPGVRQGSDGGGNEDELAPEEAGGDGRAAGPGVGRSECFFSFCSCLVLFTPFWRNGGKGKWKPTRATWQSRPWVAAGDAGRGGDVKTQPKNVPDPLQFRVVYVVILGRTPPARGRNLILWRGYTEVPSLLTLTYSDLV